MTATHEDLRNAAAEELQIKKAGVDLAAEDAALIDARLVRILAWLDTEGLIFWPEDEIPDGAVEPLTMVVASRIAPAFTLQYDQGAAGLILLRKFCAAKASQKPTPAVYY